MTISAGRQAAGSLPQRLKQIESQVDALVLAARQLELKAADLCQFIDRKMERTRD
jgi:hypothetical protein